MKLRSIVPALPGIGYIVASAVYLAPGVGPSNDQWGPLSLLLGIGAFGLIRLFQHERDTKREFAILRDEREQREKQLQEESEERVERARQIVEEQMRVDRTDRLRMHADNLVLLTKLSDGFAALSFTVHGHSGMPGLAHAAAYNDDVRQSILEHLSVMESWITMAAQRDDMPEWVAPQPIERRRTGGR